MPQLMLVNPKRRSAAQKAATRKLVAFNKSRKRRSVSKRRRPVSSVTRSVTVRRRRNPVRRGGMLNKAIDTTKNGAIGSMGAIAGSIVGGFLPIPANLKIGNMAIVTSALVGIGTGFGVSKFFDRAMGEKMAVGAVTVALHGAMKNAIQKAMPNLTLADDLLGDDLLGEDYYQGMLGDDYGDNLSAYTMGAYEHGEPGSFGYSGAGYTGDDGLNDDDFGVG